MSARARWDALLFDMDGLLVDSEPLWFEVEREFVQARGHVWTAEHARAGTGQGIRSTVERMSVMFGFEVQVEADANWIIDRVQERAMSLRPKKGGLDLVAWARAQAFGVAVASSSSRRVVNASLAACGYSPMFEVTVSGDDVARTKPAPDLFLEAARRLGVTPGRCLVLEDAMAGVIAAKAAGMDVIAVPEDFEHSQAFVGRADWILRDLTEAELVLQSIGK